MGLYKKLAAPCLFWLPAVFGTRLQRLSGLIVNSFVTSGLQVMISLNGMKRPSIGHLRGVIGIIQFHFFEIVVGAMIYFPLVLAISYIPERVLGDLWRAAWLLPPVSAPDTSDVVK